MTAGEKVLGNLKRLPELLAAHSESRETQARLQKEKEEKARLLAQTRTSVTATEEALKAVETAVTALEGQLAALDLVARLKVERTKLTEGHPCPLCGATHHPWAHESPEADTAGISAQLKDQKPGKQNSKQRWTKAACLTRGLKHSARNLISASQKLTPPATSA